LSYESLRFRGLYMSTTLCRYCGSSDLKVKEVEIRRVNAVTMAIAALYHVTEHECSCCGWIGTGDYMPAASAG